MEIKKTLAVGLIGIMISSCAVIQPGEVGVKRTLGKLSKKTLSQGAYGYNPFVTQIVRTPIRTENIEINLNLPSKEGLNVNADISILYKIEEKKAPSLIENIGEGYENIIRSVFRSASADVCAKFLAKDMHSGKRADIEKEISIKMNEVLNSDGILIDAVLLKSIQLPQGLYNSIEGRLQAEQEALRMQYVLEQEKLEAERKIIEARGSRDAQKILSEGLTPEIIKLRSIEAFIKLSESNGAKVIITDGEAPFLIDNE